MIDRVKGFRHGPSPLKRSSARRLASGEQQRRRARSEFLRAMGVSAPVAVVKAVVAEATGPIAARYRKRERIRTGTKAVYSLRRKRPSPADVEQVVPMLKPPSQRAGD